VAARAPKRSLLQQPLAAADADGPASAHGAFGPQDSRQRGAGVRRERSSSTSLQGSVLHLFAKGAVCYYDATGDVGFASELRPA
jgi:hypothetical protein